MILRIFLILFVIVFYDKIILFLEKNKLNSFKNISKKITNNSLKINKKLYRDKLKENLKIIKKKDKRIYKSCIVILTIIHNLKKNIINNVDFNVENDDKNMKLEFKKLLNLISSLVINHGIFAEHENDGPRRESLVGEAKPKLKPRFGGGSEKGNLELRPLYYSEESFQYSPGFIGHCLPRQKSHQVAAKLN